MTDATQIYLNSITFSDSAVDYLAGLLEKQDCEGIGVRMFIMNPGTPEAETCLSYCRPGEEKENDVKSETSAFSIFFEERSLRFLEDATVDFNKDKMGGQLTIKAPNSRVPQVSDDSPLEDKVNYILWNEVNPGLAAHGGQVSLVEMTDNNIAVLQFGGGCQGCSQLDLTLKDGVERSLMNQLPELAGVKDITDHSDTSNAYFR